ncbi:MULTISPECIES: hypothetical protein [Corallococcus]|uniref:hypothetical protein n=1 Tax=Corallococcus TaxID=83461 RepID=UPI00117D456C|nr:MULTISPECIES: hypothetical protein [Corallococcus]NBD08468.1 hypothetical protein [Corallococcus silvisoli]TSC34410.1 hypothetical protein FOF48_05135 [Corallococcus sp. Z5C101001]
MKLGNADFVKVKNEQLYFYDQHLRTGTLDERRRRKVWVDDTDALLMPVDEDGFLEFYERYRGGATFSRGICATHWGWDDLFKRGSLVSAGQNPKPNWTNCNGPDVAETRWLPAYPFEEFTGAAMIALGNLDEWTASLASSTEVPVGVVATIRASATNGPAVCWGTAGEIQVDGPLAWGNFTLTAIWLGPGGIYRSKLSNYSKLWPHRPYKPSKEAFIKWKSALDEWSEDQSSEPELTKIA